MTKRAISPVVGVALLIVIVTALAAVVGGLMVDFEEKLQDPGSQVAIEVTSKPSKEDDGFIREDVELVDLLSFECRVRTEHPVCEVWTVRLVEREGDTRI